MVCHYFADLSEFGYGVSILNIASMASRRRGMCSGQVSCAARRVPDPNADTGRQRFGYAVAPHKGGFGEAVVTRAGVEFNREMRIVWVEELGGLEKMLECITIEGPPNVFLDTIKRGEDDEGLDGHYKVKPRAGMSVIVRVFEGSEGAARSTIRV